MRKRAVVGVLVAALSGLGLFGSPAGAQTNAKEKVECLFRVYIQEGESGLECLT
jgi:hypothetical protein